jgi:hypothetical protein
MKDAVNMVSQHFERVSFSNASQHQAESGSSRQHKKKFKSHKVSKVMPHKKTSDEKLCKFCKSPKHLDYVSFIDELFLVNFLLIPGGLTQVPLCTFPIHCRHSIRSEL